MTKNLQLAHLNLPIGSIEAYIRRVNAIPMLTAEEELDCAKRWHEAQDVEAARRLVLAHLRFVVKIAQGYRGYGLALADLIQEGNIGLMKAVKRFDPAVGVRLVSFAVHWIKAEMHEFIIKNWRIVKIATTKAQRKLFFNLRRFKNRLGWFSAEEVADVAKELNVTAREVLEMESRLNGQELSLEGDDDEEGASPAPIHYLEDTAADPAAQFEANDWSAQNRDRLHDALAALDPRSRDILAQRWLQEERSSTLHELAAQYSVSPERIRQLEQNAMKKLRLALAA